MDFVETVRSASTRFADAASAAGWTAGVPCCPDWRVADLVWHLTEVQHFWATIVEERQSEPDVPDLDRPADDALLDWFRAQSGRLTDALAAADPYDECWSWDENEGGTVSWVRRRQAHEALVHRVDAEQAAGWELDPIPMDLAVDGVAEVLTVQLSGIPAWAEFVPGGGTMELYASDARRAFGFEIGRMVGTSLASGRHYDLGALELRDGIAEPSAIVAAPAADLYLWLWGRRGEEDFRVDGDHGLLGVLRALAAEATG